MPTCPICKRNYYSRVTVFDDNIFLTDHSSTYNFLVKNVENLDI